MTNIGLDGWLAVFARVAPIVALHPLFGGRATPSIVKASVATVLATALWSNGVGTNSGRGVVATVLVEATIGLAIAAVGIAVFGAIEAAGRFVDDARGANSARLFSPQMETTTSPLGALDAAAALALFWALGQHAVLFSALSTSFQAVPAGGLVPDVLANRSTFLVFLLDAIGSLARASLAMAGPAAAATVTVDVVLGLVSRTSPQANTFSMSMPLKLSAALVVTALSMTGRATQWGDAFSHHQIWVRTLLGG